MGVALLIALLCGVIALGVLDARRMVGELRARQEDGRLDGQMFAALPDCRITADYTGDGRDVWCYQEISCPELSAEALERGYFFKRAAEEDAENLRKYVQDYERVVVGSTEEIRAIYSFSADQIEAGDYFCGRWFGYYGDGIAPDAPGFPAKYQDYDLYYADLDAGTIYHLEKHM